MASGKSKGSHKNPQRVVTGRSITTRQQLVSNGSLFLDHNGFNRADFVVAPAYAGEEELWGDASSPKSADLSRSAFIRPVNPPPMTPIRLTCIPPERAPRPVPSPYSSTPTPPPIPSPARSPDNHSCPTPPFPSPRSVFYPVKGQKRS
ncbi:hypothetical protein RCL1_000280 [Eukaryota sp. TZLM3-RCL]